MSVLKATSNFPIPVDPPEWKKWINSITQHLVFKVEYYWESGIFKSMCFLSFHIENLLFQNWRLDIIYKIYSYKITFILQLTCIKRICTGYEEHNSRYRVVTLNKLENKLVLPVDSSCLHVTHEEYADFLELPWNCCLYKTECISSILLSA